VVEEAINCVASSTSKLLDKIISGKEVSREKRGELMEQKNNFMEIQAEKVTIERNTMAMVTKMFRIDVYQEDQHGIIVVWITASP
jgi:hypothetical protein